jgi:hypothetical protein
MKTKIQVLEIQWIAPPALFLPASTTLSGRFRAASGAGRGGFLLGATCTGFGPASGATALLFGLSTTCTRFGTASTAFAVAGATGDRQAGTRDQSGNTQTGQHLFQVDLIHSVFTSFSSCNFCFLYHYN